MKAGTLRWGFYLLLAAGIGLFAGEGTQQSRDPGQAIQSYAGPGWSVLFGVDGTGEIASLGPVMFRISERTFLGPMVAYEESASEGPGTFLAGTKTESYLPRLSSTEGRISCSGRSSAAISGFSRSWK